MTERPNVLWIVVDQLRAQAIGINGDPNVRTPNIDFLARTGINYKNAVSGFPVCCPFRGSMLTGLYPHKCNPGHDTLMPPQQKTIAHIFEENGYETCYFGKWHLDGGPVNKERAGTHYVAPKRRGGFRTWIGYENNNAQMDCWVHGHRDGQEIEMYRLPGYETDALTDLMLNYLDEKKDQSHPFFAVLSIQPPHNPYVASPEYARHTPAEIKFRENVPDVKTVRDRAAYELSGYYSMIEQIDANVGRIYSKLKETGLLEKTHIIFFSDHGDMHGSHGQFRKSTAYEEAVRIPFIISGEKLGAHEVGRRTGNIEEVFMNHVDIAPTTLGLCKITPPKWMQGHDYSRFRYIEEQGEKDNSENYPDSVYLQTVLPTGHFDSVNKPWRGIITKDGYKYVCFEGVDWLLFNLNEDPYEQVNLAHDNHYRALRNRLHKKLKSWIEKTEDDFLLPPENMPGKVI